MKYKIWYQTNNDEIYEEYRSDSNVPREVELSALIAHAKQVGSIECRGGLKDFGIEEVQK